MLIKFCDSRLIFFRVESKMEGNVLKSHNEWSLGTCLRWRINVHPDEEDYRGPLRCWPGGGVTGVLKEISRSFPGDFGYVFGSWNETRIRLFVIFRGGCDSGMTVNSVMKIEGTWSDMGTGEKETEIGKEEGEKKVKFPGKYAKVSEGRVISYNYDGDTTFDKVTVLWETCYITCVGNFEDEAKELEEENGNFLSMSKKIKEYLLSLPEDH